MTSPARSPGSPVSRAKSCCARALLPRPLRSVRMPSGLIAVRPYRRARSGLWRDRLSRFADDEIRREHQVLVRVRLAVGGLGDGEFGGGPSERVARLAHRRQRGGGGGG